MADKSTTGAERSQEKQTPGHGEKGSNKSQQHQQGSGGVAGRQEQGHNQSQQQGQRQNQGQNHNQDRDRDQSGDRNRGQIQGQSQGQRPGQSAEDARSGKAAGSQANAGRSPHDGNQRGISAAAMDGQAHVQKSGQTGGSSGQTGQQGSAQSPPRPGSQSGAKGQPGDETDYDTDPSGIDAEAGKDAADARSASGKSDGRKSEEDTRQSQRQGGETHRR